ncbi:hypothetical protein CR51_35695 [Caballeronia megalochromosomata]|nr:hypothetical protein CR51_35695 [Caballeronia megalochromosomata]
MGSPRLAIFQLCTSDRFDVQALPLFRELSGRMGLNAMMRAIVAAAPDQYDSLIGLRFDDQ